MDNDNKIIEKVSKQRHQDVLLFLQSELEPLKRQAGGNAYNLDAEYAKTKKNHSRLVLFTILGCITVLGIGFWLMNSSITKNNREISVNLEEFDGVNLKDLIDSVSRIQEKYDEALKSLTTLKAEMSVELKNAEDKRDQDLMVIESLKLKRKKDEDSRKEAVMDIYNETVRLIHEKYDADINAGEMQVQEYKAQVDEFDAAKFNAAREKEQALDSERHLQELKQKELTTRYENRISKLETTIDDNRRKANEELRKTVRDITDTYQARIDLLDPVFNDARGTEIVSNNSGNAKRLEENSVYGEEGESIKDEYLVSEYYQALKVYKDYKYLQGKISGIPHEKDMPNYLKTSRNLVDEMAGIFVDSSLRVYNEKEKMQADYERQLALKNAEIATEKKNAEAQRSVYESVLESNLVTLKTNAIVVSPKDEDNIELYIAIKARYLIVEEGTKAEIRAGKVVIKGRIFFEGGKYIFHPDKNADGSIITPFVLSEVLHGTSVKILG
ncbi:MAG: hypothetical protein MJ176_10360 [Treponema sp.]|nr:hypothetical protein [Treponema sp.]